MNRQERAIQSFLATVKGQYEASTYHAFVEGVYAGIVIAQTLHSEENDEAFCYADSSETMLEVPYE